MENLDQTKSSENQVSKENNDKGQTRKTTLATSLATAVAGKFSRMCNLSLG